MKAWLLLALVSFTLLSDMIKDAIKQLAEQKNLTRGEAYSAMDEIMSGNATEAQIAAFLMGLRLKGETVDEIAGCAQVMREKAVRISTKRPDVIDTCGTGGDASGTFNISTTAAIIASAAGANVAKHGNRAVSSRCGSADVLRALGLNIDIPPEKVSEILDELGITFLFAPHLHGAMKYAVNVRRDMGVRTIFNILGPLTNPAGAKRQVVGVFDAALTDLLANVLKELGSQWALVIHGEGGFDEFSTLGWTRVSELREGKVTTKTIQVNDTGVRKAEFDTLLGGSVEENAQIIRDLLDGKDGAPREIALLNAGAALLVAGIASSVGDGVIIARDAIDSGKAKRQLKQWIEATNS